MRNKLLLVVVLMGLCAFNSSGQLGQRERTVYMEFPTSEDDQESLQRAEGPQRDITTTQTDADAEAKREYPMVDYSKPKKYIVNEINVHGVKFLDPITIVATSGLKKGDEIYVPGEYVSQAIKGFWNRKYFSDIEVTGEIVGDSINLDIFFTERPMVYSWKFDGVKKGQQTDIKEKLSLKPGQELSDFVINKYINQIKEFYFEKGFRNVEVVPRVDNDTTFRNAVTVTFEVTRGAKVKIGKIEFSGNEEFKDKRLRKAFKKTHQKSINFFKNTKFNAKNYENDKEELLDFYNSRGYRNANIVSDSLYVINDKRVGLGLTIDEGNKYYFRNITWVGNSVHPTNHLAMLLGIESGDTYDRKTMYKRLGVGKEDNPEDMSVKSLYQNEGYLFFQIVPAEIIIGADSIDLEVKISEGKQAIINEVIISGNMKVNDDVIRRELHTRPGDLYNRALLMSTMRQLSQMGHFNPEAILPGIDPISGEMTNITWDLEEKGSDRVEISGGWGGGMFVGSVGLELNNLSLKRFFKKGAWRPYPQGQGQQLKIRAQSNGSYYKSFSVSFTEPWLGGKKPNSLTVSTHYSNETNASYMWQSGNKRFRTVGVSVGLGKRLNWPDQYFTLYMEAGYQSYHLKDWDYFVISNGSSNIFTLTTVFGRNSVDQPIYPRRGSDFSISLALTPPYSLFDGKNYGDSKMSENSRHGWIEYHKWKLNGQWFYPLTNNGNLVLMARAQMGYIGAYDKKKQSPFEGFDVGGDGMSGYNVYGTDIIGLRGYKNGEVTPLMGRNEYARAFTKYTVELRYPLIMKPSSTIYGLIFAEGGNAFADWNHFNPFQLKRSLGFGVRVYLPIVGMIGVDWGYGFDRAVGGSGKNGGEIHYMIGMQF